MLPPPAWPRWRNCRTLLALQGLTLFVQMDPAKMPVDKEIGLKEGNASAKAIVGTPSQWHCCQAAAAASAADLPLRFPGAFRAAVLRAQRMAHHSFCLVH